MYKTGEAGSPDINTGEAGIPKEQPIVAQPALLVFLFLLRPWTFVLVFCTEAGEAG